jgi:hypothetical protein
MKFLTKSQKQFLSRREIKVGGFYPFPAFGFKFYAEPNYSSGASMDTNPFTKSLAHEFFVVKEITGDFCRGNFQSRAKGSDFYMVKEELSMRSGIEKLLLSLLLFITFFVYNLFKGGVKEETEEIKDYGNYILLGKKGFGYYLQIILVTPFWFFSLSPTKKSWKEFKYGMISHKCEYDYDKPIVEKRGGYEHTHFDCKHYGCNIVSVTDEDGNFDFDKDFNKNRATHSTGLTGSTN